MDEIELLTAIRDLLEEIKFLAGVGVLASCWAAGAISFRLVLLSKNQKHLISLLVAAFLAGQASPLIAQDITSNKVHQWDLFEDANSDGGSAGTNLSAVGSPSISGERATGFSSSNYFTMPSMSAFASDSSYTVSLWVQASSRAGSKVAISLGGSSGSNSVVIYPYDSTLGGNRIWQGSASKLVTTADPPTGSDYHHIALVVESTSSAKFYVDGVLSVSEPAWPALPGTMTGGAVGTFHAGTSQAFHGGIGQVKMFTRALDASEVAALKAQDEADLENFRNPCTNFTGEPCDGPGGCEDIWECVVADYEELQVTHRPACSDAIHGTGISVGTPILGCRRVAFRQHFTNILSTFFVFENQTTGRKISVSVPPGDSDTIINFGGGDDDDADGECNKDDCDDDGDGKPDTDEDEDLDGIPNDEDDDDDNDGCKDNEDCEDDDEDGLANCEDPDDDNDGNADHIDCDWFGEGGGCEEEPEDPVDADADGVDDKIDIDDDNDGWPDWVDDDDDGDGIPDEEDDDDNGTPWPGDADGDGDPDNTDPDDDNDGIPDTEDDDDNGNGIPDDEEPPRDEPEQCVDGGGFIHCCPMGSVCEGLPACDSPQTCCENDNDCDGVHNEDDPDDDNDGTPDDEDDDDDGDGEPDDDDPDDPDDPDEPGSCACCEELLGLLDHAVPDAWEPGQKQIITGDADGLAVDFNTGLPTTGNYIEGEWAQRREDNRSSFAEIGSAKGFSNEDTELGSEISAKVPSIDTIALPIPEIGAEPGDMMIAIPMMMPGNWGTTIRHNLVIHTLPMENMTQFPGQELLWQSLETFRQFVRPLGLALFIWLMMGRFVDLFRDPARAN